MDTCLLCRETIPGRCKKTVLDNNFCNMDIVEEVLGSNPVGKDSRRCFVCELCKTKIEGISHSKRTIQRLTNMVDQLKQEQSCTMADLKNRWSVFSHVATPKFPGKFSKSNFAHQNPPNNTVPKEITNKGLYNQRAASENINCDLVPVNENIKCDLVPVDDDIELEMFCSQGSTEDYMPTIYHTPLQSKDKIPEDDDMPAIPSPKALRVDLGMHSSHADVKEERHGIDVGVLACEIDTPKMSALVDAHLASEKLRCLISSRSEQQKTTPKESMPRTMVKADARKKDTASSDTASIQTASSEVTNQESIFNIPVNSIVQLDGVNQAKVIGVSMVDNKRLLTVKRLDNNKLIDVDQTRVAVLPPHVQNEIRTDLYKEKCSNPQNKVDVKKNTIHKTVGDLRVFHTFLRNVGDKRSIEDIPSEQLCPLLCKFFRDVRKTDGSEYEPSTLRGFLSSFDRHLKQYDYGHTVVFSPEFAAVRELLKEKQITLKRDGKGKHPMRVDPITEAEIEILWMKSQFGGHNPQSILNTLWFYFTVQFDLNGNLDHYNLRWGDIQLKSTSYNLEYLQCNLKQEKKENDDRGWIIANKQNPSRCVVAIYKRYSALRPPGLHDVDAPFYLIPTLITRLGDPWYKHGCVGANKLAKFMKQMMEAAGIQIPKDRRISNQSAKKHGKKRKQENSQADMPRLSKLHHGSGMEQTSLETVGSFQTLNPVTLQLCNKDPNTDEQKNQQIVLYVSTNDPLFQQAYRQNVLLGQVNGPSQRILLPKQQNVLENTPNKPILK